MWVQIQISFELVSCVITINDARLKTYSHVCTINTANIMGLALLAVALTAVPFALWFGAIERAGAVAVAPFMLLVPVTAFILDALVKNTQPTVLQLVGAALVMGGLALSQRGGLTKSAHGKHHAHKPVAH